MNLIQTLIFNLHLLQVPANYNKAKLTKSKIYSETKITSLNPVVLKTSMIGPSAARICSGNTKKPPNSLSKTNQKDSPKKHPEVKSGRPLKKHQTLNLRVNPLSVSYKKRSSWKKQGMKPLKSTIIAKKHIRQ